ncbi:hypothetical protein B0H14DRAFT_3433592 [Mycena olivaceomarginata]|nr:hypothetical protein B0H14DRAFT_3433592 [Mycena olivaceomarginata]
MHPLAAIKQVVTSNIPTKAEVAAGQSNSPAQTEDRANDQPTVGEKLARAPTQGTPEKGTVSPPTVLRGALPFLGPYGIIHQTTAAHTPEQNGVSERTNETLVSTALIMRLTF